MPQYTLQNLTVHALPAYYLDSENEQQSRVIDAKKTDTFFANDLMPATVKAIAKKKLKLVTETVSSFQAPRIPNSTFGLSFVGQWGARVHYRPGNIVFYAGAYYMVINKVTGSTVPSSDPTNYALYSISAPEQFFGVESSVMLEGEGLFSDGADGWINTKITDTQVDTISVSKVSGLQTNLDQKLALGGGTMSGALVLSGAPTIGLHAATKTYADSKLALSGGTMTGALTLSGPPSAGLDAATKDYVDAIGGGFMQVTGATMTGALNLNGSYTDGSHAIDKDYADTKLPKGGGTMTGFITLHADPGSDLQAATKRYADTKLPKGGGTMTGALVLSGAPTANLHATTKNYVDTQVSTRIAISGGTFTGAVSGVAPTTDLNLSTKKYVDDTVAPLSSDKVSIGGDTMTGFLILHQDPSEELHAATKGYVDSVVDGNIGSGYVPASGGVMTGALTGAHGLLGLEGGTLTGELVLARKTSGADGLYEQAVTEDLFYGDKRIVTEPKDPVTVTSNYIALPDDRVILADNARISKITLPSPENFFSVIHIKKISENPDALVFVEVDTVVGRTSEAILSVKGQSVTYRPSSTGWSLIDAYTPSTTEFYIEWDDPIVNDPEVGIGGHIQTRTLTSRNFTNVTDEGGGLIGLTMVDTSGYLVGDLIEIKGSVYDGFYLLEEVSSGTLKIATTFTIADIGSIEKNTYADVTSAQSFLLSLSSSGTPLDGYNGDWSLTATTGSITKTLLGDNSLTQIQTDSGGDFVISITDNVSNELSNIVGYANVLPALSTSLAPSEYNRVVNVEGFSADFISITQASGSQTASAVQPQIAPETNVAITDGTLDGGGVWVSLTDISKYREGQQVEVSNSTSYNGTKDILEVDQLGSRIRIDEAYVSNEAGDVYGNWRVRAFTSIEESLTTGNVTLILGNEGSVLETGDEVTVLGTTNYDGVYTIVEVTDDRIEITAPWEGSETGEVTYDSLSSLFTVSSTDDFSAGDPISISSSGLGYNGEHNLLYIDGALVAIDIPYVGDESIAVIENEGMVLTLDQPVGNRFAIADEITVSFDTVGGDGIYTVQKPPLNTELQINARYSATDLGSIDTTNAVILTLLDETPFEQYMLVRIKGVESLGIEVLSEVLEVDATSHLVHVRAPFTFGLGTVGHIEVAGSKPLHLSQL